MNRKDELRLLGVYTLNPSDMLAHAIHLALEVAGGIALSKYSRALVTLARDQVLTERATALILRDMLRQMVDREEPTKASFRRLVDAVAALARED